MQYELWMGFLVTVIVIGFIIVKRKRKKNTNGAGAIITSDRIKKNRK